MRRPAGDGQDGRVRAGVDEGRFTRIEGYADRKLKIPNDSEAAGNRRIEILLQQVDE